MLLLRLDKDDSSIKDWFAFTKIINRNNEIF